MSRRLILFACLAFCLVIVSSIASAKTLTLNAAQVDKLPNAGRFHANRSYVISGAEKATLDAKELAHTCKDGATGGSVWMKILPDRTMDVTLTTLGTALSYAAPFQNSAQDTVMSVYITELDEPLKYKNLYPVACNDNMAPGVPWSQISMQMGEGSVFYVQISAVQTVPMQAGSSFSFNAKIDNVIENGDFDTFNNPLRHAGGASKIPDWKKSGAGKANAYVACLVTRADGCSLKIDHNGAGAVKVKQAITTFAGFKLDKGAWLRLSALVGMSGAQDFRMSLKVFYADGTTAEVFNGTTATPPNPLSDQLMMTDALIITKKVEKVVVLLHDKSTSASGYLEIDNVILGVYPESYTRDVAPVLPMP